MWIGLPVRERKNITDGPSLVSAWATRVPQFSASPVGPEGRYHEVLPAETPATVRAKCHAILKKREKAKPRKSKRNGGAR